VAERLHCILTPAPKIFATGEHLGQFPHFFCDTHYCASLIFRVSGLGSYSQKPLLQPVKVIAMYAPRAYEKKISNLAQDIQSES